LLLLPPPGSGFSETHARPVPPSRACAALPHAPPCTPPAHPFQALSPLARNAAVSRATEPACRDCGPQRGLCPATRGQSASRGPTPGCTPCGAARGAPSPTLAGEGARCQRDGPATQAAGAPTGERTNVKALTSRSQPFAASLVPSQRRVGGRVQLLPGRTKAPGRTVTDPPSLLRQSFLRR
jgi:hypothetical protein